MTRIRHSITSEAGQQNLEILGEAVQIMKQLPASNPHSWAYQAGIHGSKNSDLQNKPYINTCPHYNQAGDEIKRDAEGKPVGNTTSLHFSTWHRLYLYHFEEVVRAVSGIDSFTLPYWEITDPDQQKIPTSFLVRELGGTPGLFEANRGVRPEEYEEDTGNPNQDLNQPNTYFLDTFRDRIDHAIQELTNKENADYITFNNAVENNPHNIGHVAIGGTMYDVQTAGEDPMFWVHHANVDRLWATYSNTILTPEELNEQPAGMTYGFFDGNQNAIEYSYSEAAEAIYKLDYGYDTGVTTAIPMRENTKAAEFNPDKLIFSTDINQALNNLENAQILFETPIDFTEDDDKRVILEIHAHTPPDLGGTIDVLLGDDGSTAEQQLLIQDDLISSGNQKLIDAHYIGTINQLAHGKNHDMEGSHDMTMPNSYYFDITDEISLSNNSDDVKDFLLFQYEGTQPGELFLQQINIYEN